MLFRDRILKVTGTLQVTVFITDLKSQITVPIMQLLLHLIEKSYTQAGRENREERDSLVIRNMANVHNQDSGCYFNKSRFTKQASSYRRDLLGSQCPTHGLTQLNLTL